MSDRYCFLNGEILPEKDASLPLSDIGILRAYAVYDGIAAFNGKPFLFQNHYDRFVRSAKALGISIPYSNSLLYDALCDILDKSGLNGRATIRAIATGGKTIGGIDFESENSVVFFTVTEFSPLPQTYFVGGARLITYEYQREFPEYKTVNYITGVLQQKKRKEADAVEVLYTKDGYVLECATSNIFIVQNDTLITPKRGVLPGITKKLILALAEENGIPYEERDVSTLEMFDADEVFITSSFKDVVPIVSIDDNRIGEGHVGPISEKMMELFAAYIESNEGLDLETRL